MDNLNFQTVLCSFLGISALIELTPIQFNPWSWLARQIGRAVNGEVMERMGRIEQEVHQMKVDADVRNAILCRTHILRFGDELLHDVHHSKEHFEQIIREIDTYEAYCEQHPDFENNTTVITTKLILDTYQSLLEKHGFL